MISPGNSRRDHSVRRGADEDGYRSSGLLVLVVYQLASRRGDRAIAGKLLDSHHLEQPGDNRCGDSSQRHSVMSMKRNFFVALMLFTSAVAFQAQRAPVPIPAGVKFEKNVLVAMRDGVRLAADVYRPDRAGPGMP